MQHSIFISYRRDDSEGEAGRLYDDLVRTYGKNAVFMDVAGIAPGLDFRKAIDDNVAACGVFLVVIGPQWAIITGPDGQRRLDDSNDFVRLEVASALARNIPVIPVLVHEARMPRPEQLPDNIKDLAYRNSVAISHVRWDSDVQLVIDALKQYVTTTPTSEHEPVHAAVPVQLPPPVSTEPPRSSTAPKSRVLLIAAACVAVLLLALIGYFVIGRKPQARRVSTDAPPASSPEQANVLTGIWRNTAPKNGPDALIMLRIDGSGPAYNVQPVGHCPESPQGECRWTARTVVLENGRASSSWKPRNTPQEIRENRVVALTLEPSGENLRVTVTNTLSRDPNSPPQSNTFEFTFERQP